MRPLDGYPEAELRAYAEKKLTDMETTVSKMDRDDEGVTDEVLEDLEETIGHFRSRVLLAGPIELRVLCRALDNDASVASRKFIEIATGGDIVMKLARRVAELNVMCEGKSESESVLIFARDAAEKAAESIAAAHLNERDVPTLKKLTATCERMAIAINSGADVEGRLICAMADDLIAQMAQLSAELNEAYENRNPNV